MRVDSPDHMRVSTVSEIRSSAQLELRLHTTKAQGALLRVKTTILLGSRSLLPSSSVEGGRRSPASAENG